MRGFVPTGASVTAVLDGLERRVLAGVVADVARLLGAAFEDGDGGPSRPGGSRPGAHSQGPGGPEAAWSQVWPDRAPAPPDDPAVARLLPPASRDDPELAAEFRRLSEADLRVTKIAALRLVWTALREEEAGPLVVDVTDAPRWAAALTDVRLVLADRLGIEDEDDAARVHGMVDGALDRDSGGSADGDGSAGGHVPDEAEVALATVYTVLTWLQETLLEAMLG